MYRKVRFVLLNLYKDHAQYEDDCQSSFADADVGPRPEPETPNVEQMPSIRVTFRDPLVSPNVWVPDGDIGDIPEYVPMGNEAESDAMPESTDENWFGEALFDQEENIEGQMETDVDENQNEANKTNVENAKVVTSLQKNLNSNKLMDLNSTAFKLKFNPRHRYDNFLKTLTTEEEIERMKGTGSS